MSSFSEEALILRPVDYRERDRILTFLTQTYGKRSGIVHGAKSLKSASRAGSEPLILARVEFTERRQSEMVRVQHCESLEAFPAIRREYPRFLHASYFAELLLLAEIPPDDAQRCFDWLLNILRALQKHPADPAQKLRYEWEFLEILGVQPDVRQCLISGQALPPEVNVPEKTFYQLDARLGGVRSPQHTEPHNDASWLSAGSVALLRQLAERPELSLTPTLLNLRELHKAMLIYLRYHLGREPRSHALIKIQAT